MPDDLKPRRARCPGPSTPEILASDAKPGRDILGEGDVDFLGDEDLPIDAYVSPAFHRSEVEKVWRRCWQVACREDQLAHPGDHVVYDVAELSAIVLRDRDGHLRAFVNSCPHRGTRIVDGDGRSPLLRCTFHGLTWNLDGSVKLLPCAWDFPDAGPEKMALMALPVGSWGGFVFVSFDPAAPPLADYLEDLPAHFARWPMERRFTAAHAVKRFACNWKVALEAFLETFHVIGLHPDAMPFFGDANSEYDVWRGRRHYSRMINPSGVASPHVAAQSSPQRVVDAAARFGLCAPGPLAPGETPRGRIAASLRAFYRDRMGVDLSNLGDGEVIDVIEYNLFPNLIVFGGYGSPLAYRARPDGDDPNACIFEVWLLLPWAEGTERPPSAPTRWLAENETFGDVEALSYYGTVLDQDAVAMPLVQRGLRASRKGTVTLSNYQEIRIRHMRRTLAEYLAG